MTEATTKLDDSIEFTALLSFGGGVDYRISEQLIAGVALSATAPTGAEELRTFSGGIHLGYGWNP